MLTPPSDERNRYSQRSSERDVDASNQRWLFGYGSLVWRAEFPYTERRRAWIRGYSRRFWQASTDHRGLPDRPGRVVTLVPEAGARCLGVAYRLPDLAAEADGALRQLDHRERGGYTRRIATLEWAEHPATAPRIEGSRTPTSPDRSASEAPGRPSPVTAWFYIATPDNRNYLGPASVEAAALQIRRAQGPSGRNSEYVFELERFLRRHGAIEPHVFALAAALRARGAG